jgi:hypothetical protein
LNLKIELHNICVLLRPMRRAGFLNMAKNFHPTVMFEASFCGSLVYFNSIAAHEVGMGGMAGKNNELFCL